MPIQRLFSFLLAFFTALYSLVMPRFVNRAQTYVNDMTLEQKIGQMLMPAFRTWTENGVSRDVTKLYPGIEKAVKTYGFGGVILFSENCQGTEQTARLVYDMQTASAAGLAGMPMLVGIDQEGGYIVRLQTGTGTMGNMALGAINDKDETRAAAGRIASELAALGINVDFAPDLDVNCNPSNPVIGIRSFSSDPQIAADMGEAYITGMHDENVATAAKHFPGHGDTATDSHTGLPLINKTCEQLRKTELIPFAAGIDAGTDMIMTAHIVFPQIEKGTYTSKSTGKQISLPATLSKTIVTDILRGEMGFEGVVITDAMNMGAISDNFSSEDAAVLAINAGVDMLLMPVYVTKEADISAFGDYIAMIARAVKNGRIREERIDEAVRRIVTLKLKRHILASDGMTENERVALAKKTVGSLAHHEAELAAAERAITVLKNDGALPLTTANGKAPLFLYPYTGEEPSVQYAVDHLKKLSLIPAGIAPKISCYRYTSASDFTAAVNAASSVVVFSESYGANYFDPASSSGWQAIFIDAMIAKAHSLGKKVTVVSLHLPYDAAKYTAADALVLAYGAKDMKTVPEKFDGETKTFGINIPAAVCVMFGETKPQGKCPVDIPKLNAACGYSSSVLYPVGYGLTF